VNMRTKIDKWSANGALNAIKDRLAYYYNGFDPLEEMNQKEVHVYYMSEAKSYRGEKLQRQKVIDINV